LSRKIHWYVRSGFGSSDEILAVPYIDFPDMDAAGSNTLRLDDFIRETAIAATRGPINALEMTLCGDYFNILIRCFRGDRDCASGYLLLTVTENGSVTFMPVSDLSDFMLTPQELIARVQEREQQMRRESIERSQKQKHNRLLNILATRQQAAYPSTAIDRVVDKTRRLDIEPSMRKGRGRR
jgi:hypothetical protein